MLRSITRTCCVVLIFSTLSLFGATTIGGDISSITFTASGNPYIIDSNLVVPRDCIVIIESGCVLLFREYTELLVKGYLVVNGTSSSPVLFTSINDTNGHLLDPAPLGTPAPHSGDWNGITVDSGAKIECNYLMIAYSYLGITSASEEVIFNACIFSNNIFTLRFNDTYREGCTPDKEQPFSYKVKSKHSGLTGEMHPRRALPEKSTTGMLVAQAQTDSLVPDTVIRDAPRPLFNLSVLTEPESVEVYCNLKPTLRNRSTSITPYTITTDNPQPVTLSLLKPGFRDTAITWVPKSDAQELFCKLQPADSVQLLVQQRFLRTRAIVRAGRIVALSVGGVAAITGGLLYRRAINALDKAEEYRTYLESTVEQAGPNWDEAVEQNRKKVHEYNRDGTTATVFWGLAAVFTAAGVVFYF